MDDFVVNVRQIVQYPRKTALDPTDLVLLQESDSTGLAAGAYKSASVVNFVGTALEDGGFLHLAPNSGIAWNGSSLTWSAGAFTFTDQLVVPSLTVNGTIHASGDVFSAGEALATQVEVTQLFDDFLLNSVSSFNGRTGNVLLEEGDVLRAGGVLQNNAHFHGIVTAPTIWDGRVSNEQIATTEFVHNAFAWDLSQSPILLSPDCTQVAHPLSIADINAAYGVTNTFPAAPNPPLGDASNRIATTLFVDDSMQDLAAELKAEIGAAVDLSAYAKLDSPQFTGIPTADTANPGTHTGQLATTAFVMNAVAASTAGVATWNGRTGTVTMTAADITTAGGALLASPVFTGAPTAPTAAPGNNSQQLATTAFVEAALLALPSAGVSSFNTRTGAVVLTTADITGAGGAPVASPALTGTPTAPTAPQTDSSTTLATTAYVRAAITALPTSVSSFNGRTGAITLIGADVSAAGGALIASPGFTGTPTAPTAPPATNTGQIATTAFVQAAITASTGGVTTFNGRAGAVTLNSADITSAGGAPLASPALTGTPTAPTAAQASNDTTISTTAYVRAAIAAVNVGVLTFNSRSGSVTLQGSDVSAAGGALIASPTFTGTPAGPTATAGTNTTQLATCAFVMNQLATAGGVTSFNGRAGVVTLTAADLTGAGGALLASPTFTGTPSGPTAAPGTNTTQLATTAFVAAAAPGAITINVQTFTASGTYTPTPGMKFCTMEVVGGGGGGSGVGNSSTNSFSMQGGGSGAYSRRTVSAATVGASQPVTIGPGGAGGSAGGGNAGAGGATSVGTLCVANGGGGAAGYSAGLWTPGAGGSITGAVGDVIAAGNPGGPPMQLNFASTIGGADGGASFFGGAGIGASLPSAASSAVGGAASNYGGGGGGAAGVNVTTTRAGGAGSPGVAIITEYI